MAKYKNKLGLQGIPHIKEIIPQDIGLFFGLFYNEEDEVIHFADTLKEWKRQRKSLADYIQNAEHRDAVLQDLYTLKDWIDEEVRGARNRQGTLNAEGNKYFSRRESFLSETFPYEEGRLLSWEPPNEREDIFHFDQLKGFCLITRQNGIVTKLTLHLEESGLFTIDFKDAANADEQTEPIVQGFRVDNPKTTFTVPIKPLPRSGMFYIHNQTRKVTERVPV